MGGLFQDLRYGARMLLRSPGLATAAVVALARLISGLLFGISASDPATFLATAVILSAVALLATYIPARRATRVEPTAALRYE